MLDHKTYNYYLFPDSLTEQQRNECIKVLESTLGFKIIFNSMLKELEKREKSIYSCEKEEDVKSRLAYINGLNFFFKVLKYNSLE